MSDAVDVTVVMPCLNEADTLETCIRKAQRGLEEAGVSGEVVVADNGSTDGSRQIGEACGARVVAVPMRGYGNALMAGIAAARGKWIIMGDADDSYDFGEIPKVVGKLQEGFELVQGCRMPAGGGRIDGGAMPFLHRWLGNPMFSLMVRWWFHAPIHDVNCGFRGFTRDLQARLDQRCTGMEFAVEMVIKASIGGARIAEVPIVLHPDGRKSHPPHLRTFRDGWRTLRFFLIYSPRWLFLAPGIVLLGLGCVGGALGLPRIAIRGVTFDVNTLLFASLFILCGYQSILFALLTSTFGANEGFLPQSRSLQRFLKVFSLERSLLLACLGFAVGLTLLAMAILQWWRADFGTLDYACTMRLVAPGATLTALAFQTVLSGFFVSILNMRRR